jgi:hypothetical protein
MYLAGRNDKVNEINELMLSKLTEKTMTFKAKVRGAMKENAYPTDEYLRLKV